MYYILSTPLSSEKNSPNRTSKNCGSKRGTITYCCYALFNGAMGKIVFMCAFQMLYESMYLS